PWPHAFFETGHDLGCDPGVNVLPFGVLHCSSSFWCVLKLHALVMGNRACRASPQQSQGGRMAGAALPLTARTALRRCVKRAAEKVKTHGRNFRKAGG